MAKINVPSTQPRLSQLLPPLILGGAGFSYQTHPDPESLPVRDVIKQAFDQGIRAIDTSPFYEPSEQLLGAALSQPEITDHYSRSDYILMTKVGRIKADQFDYSPSWVQQSVNRSLQRLRTSYLDVVFCHDIEFVTDEDTLGAIGELLSFVRQGKVRYIGLSSYRIDILSRRAALVRERYGRPLDVVQNWAQMTLQNSRLELEGLKAFEDEGVSCVCNASPLAIGLLRSGGVPQGRQGDFHPAPQGLRKAAKDVAEYMTARGESLAALSLRYALWRAQEASHGSFRVCTITGISTISDLTENVETARKILASRSGTQSGDLANVTVDVVQVKQDQPLFDKAQAILGEWMNYGFTSPPKGWNTQLKRMVDHESGPS